jgi:uncharacterized phage protein (predicted DNA packaging)
MITDLGLLKEFCRIDGTENDTVLTLLAESAEQQVLNHIRRDLAADFPDGWPKPCVAAVLLLTAHLFDNRDLPQVDGNAVLPTTVRALLAPYRDLS